MKVEYDGKAYECAFEFALDVVSGKWKGLVLWHLSHGTLRYGELRKKIGKITQKMLTQTLREMEKNKLITRKVYPVVPPKVEYTITEYGKRLIPIFEQLQSWGEEVGKEISVIQSCDEKNE